MSITTISAFNYGHVININNKYINFSEGVGPELTGIMQVGSYSLGDFVKQVSITLNKFGQQEYTVQLNRLNRKITISAPSDFSLLPETGAQLNVSPFELIGFTLDKSGLNSYEADIESGNQYEPQFLLQGFVDFKDEERKASAVINQSANGDVQVVSYGAINLMSANITLASDLIPQVAITENPNGVDELREFMRYCINKNPIEFIENIDLPQNITKCLIEKTPEDGKGTAFKLKELYARNLTGYYETGTLQFRKIIF